MVFTYQPFLRYSLSFCIAIVLTPFFLFSQENDSIQLYDFSIDELMNINIESAAKRTESIADIPASIVILTRQDIKNQGWQTIEEVLNNVPGMYKIDDYLWFGSDNYGVRGFFSSGAFSSMIILVNGVNQREDWYNSFPLTKINVPVEAIDRIEVIRGPMSVVYGNNAFQGAINIITNQALDGTKASIGGGTNGNYRVFGRTSGEKDKLKYSFNAGAYGSNGIEEPYSKMTNNIDDAWQLPDNPTSKNQLTDHRMYFDGWLTYDNFHFGFSQTQTSRGVIDYYPGFDDGHLAEIQAANTTFGYSKRFNEKLEIKADASYFSFRNRLDYKHNTDTTAYGFNDIYSDAIEVEATINLNLSNNWSVVWGNYYRRILRSKLVVDAPNLSEDYVNLDAGLSRDNKKYTWASFVQTSFDISENLNLLAGIRVEQTPSYQISYAVRFDPRQTYEYLYREGTYKYGDPYLIPRAAMLFHLNENHHIKLMYGRAIKQASIGENMDIVRYPNREQLKPSNMQTFELNYFGLLSNSAIINLSLFQNHADNLISRTNQLEDSVMRLFNTNSGKLSTTGLEVSTQYKPSQKINVSASAILQKSKNRQEGYEEIALEYAPNFLAYSTISYNFLENATIGISGYYVGEMETYWRPDSRNDSDPNDNRTPLELIADGERIGEKSPGIFIINANLRFNNLFSRNFFCNIHAHNLLNTEVRYPTTRSNDVFEKGTIGKSQYFSISIGKIFN
ncbi:MAG: TonB-dependent receptor plug domain-containing protein [Bacteroidales bacterium]